MVEVGFDNFVRLPIYNSRLLRQIYDKFDDLIIFDIGACEGEDSIRYANFFPNCYVHLFEPIPLNFNTAKNNVTRHGLKKRIICNKIALSNKTGSSTMYVSSGRPKDAKPLGDWDYGNKSSSLLEPNKVKEVTPWLEFNKKIDVKTDTILNYCKNKSITKIDLMHLDVQGAELMVLKGAGNYIKKIKAIWLEAESVELYRNQPLKDELEKFLVNNDFIKIVDTVDGVAGDMLFIRNDMRIQESLELGILQKFFVKKSRLVKILPDRVGFDMYIPENHKWTFSENTYYEENVSFWMERIFNFYRESKATSVFYDVGGNCGYYSLLATGAFKLIHIFEPSEKSCKIIELNMKINKLSNYQVNNFALSNVNSFVNFFEYSSSGNDSLIKRSIPKNHELKLKKINKVPTKTLDTFIKEGASKPDMIKIDVEGAELFVLQGGIDLLKSSNPTLIIEYSQDTCRDAGYERENIAELLKSCGYQIFGISEDNKTIDLISLRGNKPISNIIATKERKLVKWLEMQ